MAEVNLPPGFELVEESAATGLPPGFMLEQAVTEPPPQTSGVATGAIAGLRSVPAIARGLARVAANHPAAAQKAINAGVTGTAASIGAVFGGTPGAITGGAVRGVAPTQMGIRETMGRLAGETPTAAKSAGRAVGAANYARETYGLPLKPTDMVSTGHAARAVDNYVESAGLRIPRVLDQYGKVVIGPEAAPIAKAPGVAGRLLTRGGTAVSAIGKVLAPLNGMAAMGDLAQAAEPNRKDIGFLGLGASQPPDAWSANQAAMRAKILALLGLGN